MSSSASHPLRFMGRAGLALGLVGLIGVYLLRGISWIRWDVKCRRTQGDIRAVGLALKMFQDHNHRLPETAEGLEALEVCPASLKGTGTWKKLADSTPYDLWDQPYQYIRDPMLSDGYGIYSFGPDRRSASRGNDPDDLCSWEPERAISQPRSWELIAAEITAWTLFGSGLFFRWRCSRHQS